MFFVHLNEIFLALQLVIGILLLLDLGMYVVIIRAL